MVTLDNWDVRMVEDMKLRDLSPKTIRSYVQATKQFVKWVSRCPSTWTEEDLRKYILFLRDERKLASATIHVVVQALRFFLRNCLRKDWDVIHLMQIKRPKRLPVVLRRSEVREVLAVIRRPVQRAALTTIYALGLRLGEALRLEARDIDPDRLRVHVRQGKGRRDRSVVLPRPLLVRLRDYWRHQRPKATSRLLFVSERTEQAPHPSLLQRTFKAALREVGLFKPASVHTLRHSYATHLVEAGVSIRVIQETLGHTSVRTTMAYTHITDEGTTTLQEKLDRLMADL